MKLVCSLPSNLQISAVKNFVDGILLEDKENIVEEIITATAYGLIPIYKLNEMVFPEEIEVYKNKIIKTKNTSCLYYITDLGLAHIAKELGLLNRTIYDPVTMIRNHLDAESFMEYGFHAIGISNEITLSDTKSIIEQGKIKAFLQVFGFRLMHTSRRALLKLYGEQARIALPKEHLTIKEALRSEHYPITEDSYGTKIYRGYILSLLEHLGDLSLEYAFIGGEFFSSDTFLEVLNCFNEKRNNPTSMLPIQRLKQLNLPIEDGFTYQDTVYLKEEF